MIGSINIRVSPKGYAVEASVKQVSPIDKFEALHSLAVALDMSDLDIDMFCKLERLGVLSSASTVNTCETTEELDQFLKGEAKPRSKEKELSEVLRELLKVLEEH